MKTTVLNAIEAERARQQNKGFDAAHDDAHDNGEILTAANLIAMDVESRDDNCIFDDEYDDWMHDLALHVRKKYGTNYKQRLLIATAMLIAELERIERHEAKK